jgi:HK97 family phage portal protein
MELISLNLPNPPNFESRRGAEKRDGSLENPAVPLTWPVELEQDGLFGPTSDAGVRVSELTALQSAIVYACVRVRAETMGQMPLNVFEHIEKNGEPAVRLASEHLVQELVYSQPNPFMSAPVWRETMQTCLDLYGNAYSVIERDGVNRPIALWPRNPKKVTPFIARFDDPARPDELWYCDETGTPESLNGTSTPKMEWWPAADMIHFVGMTFDGIVGLSPIKYFMKQTIGLAQAAEKYGARFYANNGRPGGLLINKSGQKMDEPAKKNMRDSWQEAQAGRNQGRPAVLTGDWTWVPLTVPADEMQFLQTRKLQNEQICGMLRVPPHKAGIMERSTNNNIEHQSIEFIRDNMGPVINKWQVELTNKLLPAPPTGRNAARKFFIKFDTSELLQGDFKSLVDALSVSQLSGSYSVNEARRKLGMNPIGPEGDVHTVQSQLTTLENLAAQAEAAKAQAKKTIDDIKNGVTPPSPALPAEPDAAEPDATDIAARYSILFQDAFNRVCKREKRDSEAISQAFLPLLRTVAEDANSMAAQLCRTSGLPEGAIADIVQDQVKTMGKRAEEWKGTDRTYVTEACKEEMQKAFKALRIAVYKEVAVQKAKEE